MYNTFKNLIVEHDRKYNYAETDANDDLELARTQFQEQLLGATADCKQCKQDDASTRQY